jgi:hypothetical protein
LFAVLPLCELFSLAAIRRKIEMMRKMEMRREIATGWEMEMVRGKDGDSCGNGDREIKEPIYKNEK